MKLRPAIGLIGGLGVSATDLVAAQRGAAPAPPAHAPRPALAQRIAHSDPSRYRSSPTVHGGAGTLDFFVGIARDMNKKSDLLATPPQRLGGAGRAGGPGRGRGF